jgi:hypothetical protein
LANDFLLDEKIISTGTRMIRSKKNTLKSYNARQKIKVNKTNPSEVKLANGMIILFAKATGWLAILFNSLLKSYCKKEK